MIEERVARAFDVIPAIDLRGGRVVRLQQGDFGRETVYEYDMGPGDNEYKSRWAGTSHELARLRIFRPGAYGALLHTVEARVVETVRRLRGQGLAA